MLLFSGEDFLLRNLIILTFQPEDVKLPVPFHILADSIPEDDLRENFILSISINETKPGLRKGENFTTTVNIIDDDSKWIMKSQVTLLERHNC